MSRTAADIATEVESYAGAGWHAAAPLFAGVAGPMALAESSAASLADALLYAQSEGKWLDLLARGAGLRRQAGESDASLVSRLRTPPQAVTRPLLLEAVNAILAEYGAAEAIMVEWWDSSYYDHAYYDHVLYVPPDRNWFALIVPDIGTAPTGTAFYDHMFYDSAYLGSGSGFSPAYAAIIALVEQSRAAGVSWVLYVNTGSVSFG